MGQHQSKSHNENQPSMDENGSTLSLGKQSTTECSSLGERSNATLLQLKRKLKRIEHYSLHQVFDELKTEYPDHFECIEAKKFLEHLNLPSSVEQGGILLFKSFSYLGSYPNCSSAVPLTFDAFLTAFVLLTGKMDNEESSESLFEDMFFESLAIVHSTKPSNEEEAQVEEDHPQPNEIQSSDRKSKGLSLADLGVSFDDLDFGRDIMKSTNNNSMDNDDDQNDDSSAMMLCRDLVELFTLMLYIVQLEKQEQEEVDVDALRQMARTMVESMQPREEQVSQRHFFAWKRRNAPYLFKTIQCFIYGKFGLSGQSSVTTVSDLILPEDSVSTPDTSDILTIPYCALLCWCLPDIARRVKQWPCLYSANNDGFAMNRFERNVFRYPGPTLLVIQGEVQDKTIVVGVYVPEAWKQSRHYWGSDECFVFELWPTFQVYRASGRNQQYMYYHDDFGIGMGGTSKSSAPPKQPSHHHSTSSVSLGSSQFLLMLDNTLQQGVYAQELYPPLPTFENHSHTSFYTKFDTINIEVFGLGSEKARQVQEREWDFEKREALRRAGLQFRQADGNQVDRELLRMAGIIDDDNRQER
ncbi:TLD-domain-containing protein [Phascolomyces articulosus]|uniref:Restriction of telomere capping protein 5 n=1 Tax=Phascolomyces articulosus TaxID=60185 RepID=A0AAD5JYT0_9FUNG|nr:TLD-domain-containing protein [Phascolomyces articulosus]